MPYSRPSQLKLTRAEVEVLLPFVQGCTYTEIAVRTGLHINTVYTRFSRLRQRWEIDQWLSVDEFRDRLRGTVGFG
jgi:DNA-binding NarL/FixJ family response regulator